MVLMRQYKARSRVELTLIVVLGCIPMEETVEGMVRQLAWGGGALR